MIFEGINFSVWKKCFFHRKLIKIGNFFREKGCWEIDVFVEFLIFHENFFGSAPTRDGTQNWFRFYWNELEKKTIFGTMHQVKPKWLGKKTVFEENSTRNCKNLKIKTWKIEVKINNKKLKKVTTINHRLRST